MTLIPFAKHYLKKSELIPIFTLFGTAVSAFVFGKGRSAGSTCCSLDPQDAQDCLCQDFFLQMCKSWNGAGKGKSLFVLFAFYVLSPTCILKSLEQKISNVFGLGYGDEDLLGLWGALFISLKIMIPKICWSCLGI